MNTEILNWAITLACVAGLGFLCWRRSKPPSYAPAPDPLYGIEGSANVQGNHNRITKKKVKKVSNELHYFAQCKDLQRTVDAQQNTIMHLEAHILGEAMLKQEMLGMLKDKDVEIQKLRERLGDMENLPLYDMKLLIAN
ncbi:hypothetical protein Q4E40_02895 [Pontibacter sp. BT731]|uniref:hypothetical protein n=1 Tax=Pontibacter coccineus TaxID=3063328 RepID=UPI0026E27A13|nr:hypothetical protein [Pontibacter sp. BT731]MDO6389061.1 hypothetical protein [Pontibacter sp. BT731]